MRPLFVLVALAVVALAVVPAAAQDGKAAYRVKIDPKSVFTTMRDRDGKRSRMVSLQFQINRVVDDSVVVSVPKDEIVVEEDGVKVAGLDIFQPRAHKLTTVLAIDISGSMARNRKIDQARQAALAFLDRLDERADVGLILFDHRITVAEPPVRDAGKQKEHRDKLRDIIRDMKPQGGTAWIDATVRAVEMLKGIAGRRAIVLMTDGVDMNSKHKLEDAIEAAQTGEVPVYTLGIGQPGRGEQVTTVLVLDRSGSMMGKADATDKLRKIDALKRAATRFVELMRPGAKTTLLPFSSTVDRPENFTDDRKTLGTRIKALKAHGGTLLYDATFAGIETLEASGVKGKRAVVVLTDGKDEAPGSRRSDAEVIARARELKIPLYMLGLGQPGEIDEPVMRKMATETGGTYYHAGSQNKLLELFENLSIELHDDGIDEKSLRALADQTGGKYIHVSEISKLTFFYEQLADELQQTYRVTYESRRASHDGTASGIDVKIVNASGQVLGVAEKGVDFVRRGVVVPEMSYGVYLVFLAGLGLLLLFPAVVRRIHKGYGGT
jgi:VWFA-related protein